MLVCIGSAMRNAINASWHWPWRTSDIKSNSPYLSESCIYATIQQTPVQIIQILIKPPNSETLQRLLPQPPFNFHRRTAMPVAMQCTVFVSDRKERKKWSSWKKYGLELRGNCWGEPPSPPRHCLQLSCSGGSSIFRYCFCENLLLSRTAIFVECCMWHWHCRVNGKYL